MRAVLEKIWMVLVLGVIMWGAHCLDVADAIKRQRERDRQALGVEEFRTSVPGDIILGYHLVAVDSGTAIWRRNP